MQEGTRLEIDGPGTAATPLRRSEAVDHASG